MGRRAKTLDSALEAVCNMEPTKQQQQSERREREIWRQDREARAGIDALRDSLKECGFVNIPERDWTIAMRELAARLDAAGFEIKRKPH